MPEVIRGIKKGKELVFLGAIKSMELGPLSEFLVEKPFKLGDKLIGITFLAKCSQH